MRQSTCLLVTSSLQDASQPASDWHMAAVAKNKRHVFIYSSTFNPRAWPNPDLRPRLGGDLPGCTGVVHLVRCLYTGPTSVYDGLKNGSGQGVKGECLGGFT